MTTYARLRILRWITLASVVLAFANSYNHGVSFAQSHMSATQWHGWVYTVAGFPELLVIMAVLSFPESRWGLRTLVPGSLAVFWTLCANGSSASPGWWGMFFALSPAVVSLVALTLAHTSPVQIAEPEPESLPAQEAEPADPEPLSRPEAEAQSLDSGSESAATQALRLVTAQAESHDSEPLSQAAGARAAAAHWILSQPEPVSTAMVMSLCGVSKATANRAKADADKIRAQNLEMAR